MTSNSFQVEYSEKMSSDIDNSDDEDITVAFDKSAMKSTEVDSDDSDVPVDVSWKDSKSVFEQDEKNRNNAVKFARSVDKAKRRKKNEMFISQKEAKRKLTKLPEDIVQAVVKKLKPEPDQIQEEDIKKRERKKASKINKNKRERNRKEYSHVVILDEEVNKYKKVQESAAEFLTNHFYGNRLQRTSGSKQLTMQSKSSGAVKPSFKFSNKV